MMISIYIGLFLKKEESCRAHGIVSIGMVQFDAYEVRLITLWTYGT